MFLNAPAVQTTFCKRTRSFQHGVSRVDGCEGEPNDYRDYKLRQIMHETSAIQDSAERESELV